MPNQKSQPQLSQPEIAKRSQAITKTVHSYKAKLQKLKKKQDKIMQSYIKRLEKMKIEEIKSQLG